ncbi:unnamed protein product [Mytilus coruscus]|uniref:Farnesoic acid O-methyl transferase domain-containing protein n=1 Tax=Mytilus coruscus TaxID=42192 RepID=A0A6J8DVE1_MYTCO|nr:unnamed protein product [Mytilus coruscus]
MDCHINDMLEAGVIEPGEGPLSSGIVLVKKKDGSTKYRVMLLVYILQICCSLGTYNLYASYHFVDVHVSITCTHPTTLLKLRCELLVRILPLCCGLGEYYLFASYHFVVVKSLDIFTINSGHVDTWSTRDAYNYYTHLSPYGIIPGLNDQLEFKVMACSDISVLLSSSPDLNSTDHYDVVLGGFNNGRSEIRKRGTGQVTVQTPHILSCSEFRNFTIRWSVDGVIEVKNSSAVFMRLVDVSTISVLGLGEPCVCTNQTQSSFLAQNYTYTEWREILAPKLEQIKVDMKLDKERLSSTIRKRNSASDTRTSAQRLGIIGAGVIVVEICIIIFDDILTLVMRLKHLV